jgi:hypothetical protein
MDDYLNQVAKQVTLHHKTLENTKTFLIKNNITDYDTIQSCLIIGQVWAADKLGKTLMHGDLLTYLGSDIDTTGKGMYENFVLSDIMKGLSLYDLLDFVVRTGGVLDD